MTIAPTYHSPPNHRRKRSLDEVSTSSENSIRATHHPHHHRQHYSNDEEPSQAKTQRSDFYFQRMDHRLQWALKCSREGNLRMMEFYLEQAKKDAFQCQSYGDTFCQWEAWIRGQLPKQI